MVQSAFVVQPEWDPYRRYPVPIVVFINSTPYLSLRLYNLKNSLYIVSAVLGCKLNQVFQCIQDWLNNKSINESSLL